VLDEAGAFQSLLTNEFRKNIIEVGDIETIVSKMSKIPKHTVSASDRESLRNLDRSLKMMVYGQDEAIESLSAAVKLARSGLRDERKPVGSFLFAGPTGVGKTEVARQLASLLGVELLRFDMSEYMEKHAISRLIGAPPGYVGYEEGGLLTEAVNKSPYSVVLLDEIEKAHHDIYNILLQVMDNGKLTDTNGREADFRHTIVIMTTNAGVDALQKISIGFSPATNNSSDAMIELSRLFAPEFRNRLDGIVKFQKLNDLSMRKIIGKFIAEMNDLLNDKQLRIRLTESAVDELIIQGFDSKMGARPLQRKINDFIKVPLSKKIIFDRIERNNVIIVDYTNKEFTFHIKNSSDTTYRIDNNGYIILEKPLV
jgi:ATP-dependent Clp protease ATP-binding subunit ClpA